MDVEYRVRDTQDRWRWMRSRGAPRRNEAGEIVRWYGSVESIDEHKRAVDEFRSSETRLRAIFDAAPVGMLLVEASTHKVLNANPRAEHLLGFKFVREMLWTAEGWEASDPSGRLIDGDNLPLMRAPTRPRNPKIAGGFASPPRSIEDMAEPYRHFDTLREG